jgi:hypothetical protein
MKELITTQLIEEYQKELKTKKTDFFVARNGTCLRITLAKEIFNIENFIHSLQSKQSEERQNIMTAFHDGTINDSNCSKEYYFNQTFKQEQK